MKKIKLTEEDRTWEAFSLTRQIEDAESPDYYWENSFDPKPWSWDNETSKMPYKAGFYQLKRAYGRKQISYYNKEHVRHRIFGPAIINPAYDAEFWLKDGFFHREGGPAYKERHILKWYVDGKLHRLDGPAIIANGHPKEYWIGGQRWSPKNYKKEIERRKRKGLL